mgnify:CR=1 FL=1
MLIYLYLIIKFEIKINKDDNILLTNEGKKQITFEEILKELALKLDDKDSSAQTSEINKISFKSTV